MESHLAVLAAGGGQSRGHRTLAEKAYETLHAAIISGVLRPGARLPIEELAEHLQMSPMPIREAVRHLDAVGLVDNVPHRGARVTELSVTDLAEVYEVRLALETLAMRRAAVAFTDAHAAHARRCLIELENTTDDASVAASEAHTQFHFAFYEAAQSAWLLRLVRPTWQVSERYALEWPQVRRLQERAGEHREILAACVAREPDRAAAALYEHLAITANSLAEAMGGEPLYELGAGYLDHVGEDRRSDEDEHAGAQQF
jgi:DNA-binding GntR family transcriptional regulator